MVVEFIAFMVKFYYIYGCWVYYIYGQFLLHLWLKVITFMVSITFMVNLCCIYGLYYIYGWYNIFINTCNVQITARECQIANPVKHEILNERWQDNAKKCICFNDGWFYI